MKFFCHDTSPLLSSLPSTKSWHLVQIPIAGLAAGSEEVRGQAAFALGQLAEHCQPEAAEHYQTVLPPLLSALAQATTADGQQRICYALDTFCELLGECCSNLDSCKCNVTMQKRRGCCHTKHGYVDVRRVCISLQMRTRLRRSWTL